MGSTVSDSHSHHKDTLRLTGSEKIDSQIKTAREYMEIGRSIHQYLKRVKQNDYVNPYSNNTLLKRDVKEVIADMPTRLKFLSEQIGKVIQTMDQEISQENDQIQNKRIGSRLRSIINHNRNAYIIFLKKSKESIEISNEYIERQEYQNLMDLNSDN